MTNNDKALAALKEYEANQVYDNAPKMAESILDEYAPLFIQALTPQSSADLGRVRELLQFSANGCLVPPDGGSPTIQDHIDTAKEALAILDQQAGSGPIFAEIRAALTAPIEKIEGLDEALEFTLSHDGEVNLGDIPIFVEAATRYAQGRTQNVPEITGEMFYMAMYKDKGAIWAANECQDLWNTFAANLKAMLSAAPPVTAPIEKVDGWLPIETAPKDGTPFIGYSPNMGVRRNVSFNKQRQDFDIGFSSMIRDWTHWMPQSELPAPPSARLQLQRQGD